MFSFFEIAYIKWHEMLITLKYHVLSSLVNGIYCLSLYMLYVKYSQLNQMSYVFSKQILYFA